MQTASSTDGYITKDEVLKNTANLQLNLPFQTIEVPSTESVYLCDESLGERHIAALRQLNPHVISKSGYHTHKELAEIEATFTFEILHKHQSFGRIALNGKSISLSVSPNFVEGENDRSNFEIINYQHTMQISGCFIETLAFQYDIMLDTFYEQQVPHYIGLKSEFSIVENYIAPAFQTYFKEHFQDNFKEGKTLFCWDY